MSQPLPRHLRSLGCYLEAVGREADGSGLERWYILGSVILGFGVPLVPAALGHFGLDPIYNVCYFTQGKLFATPCEQKQLRALVADSAADKVLRIRDFVLDLVRFSNPSRIGVHGVQLADDTVLLAIAIVPRSRCLRIYCAYPP